MRMKKRWNLGLWVFALAAQAHATLSLRVNLGISSVGHETRAFLLENFDEIKAYEALENFRGTITDDYAKISQQHALQATLLQFYIEEDKTGKAWENTTKTISLSSAIIDDTIGGYGTVIRLTDPTLFTGTDSTPGDLTDDISAYYNSSADPDEIGMNISNGLTASLDDHTKYTNINNDASGASAISAYAITSSNFAQIANLKDEMVPTVSNKNNFLSCQKQYNTLDAGLQLSYDFGKMTMFTQAVLHYPLSFVSRETIPLIIFSPASSFDGLLGAMINYNVGRFGAAFGISQVRGDFLMKKYERSTSGDSNLNLQYVDYTNSYNENKDLITLKGVSDSFFFGEIRAETKATSDKNFIIYGSYKVGFGREDTNEELAKVDLKQDSILIGVSYTLHSAEI